MHMFRPNSGPVYPVCDKPGSAEALPVRPAAGPVPATGKAVKLHLLPWGSNVCCKCHKIILGANYTWLYDVYENSPMACELVPDAPRKELPPLKPSLK